MNRVKRIKLEFIEIVGKTYFVESSEKIKVKVKAEGLGNG